MPRDYFGLALSKALEGGIAGFRDERAWQEKLARNARAEAAAQEKADYEREKDAPLTDEQMVDMQTTGRVTGPGVSFEKQKFAMETKSKSDLNRARNFVEVDDNWKVGAVEFGLVVPEGQTSVDRKDYDRINTAKVRAAEHKGKVEVTPEMVEKFPKFSEMGVTPGEFLPENFVKSITIPASAGGSAQFMEVTPEVYEAKGSKFKEFGFAPGMKVPTSTFNMWTKPDKMGAGGMSLTDEQITLNAKSIADGSVTLGMLGGMGSQRARINAEYEKMREANPRLAPMHQLEANQKAEYQRARTLNSQQTTDQTSAVKQFTDALDEYVKRAEAIDAGNFVPYNKLKQFSAEQIQGSKFSKDLSVMKALGTEMALQSSRVFAGNAASDIQFKKEMERLESSQSKENVKAVAAAIRQIANARRDALLGAPTYTPGGGSIPAGGSLQPSLNAPAATGYDGKSTEYIYPDGTKAKWDGSKWVKQ